MFCLGSIKSNTMDLDSLSIHLQSWRLNRRRYHRRKTFSPLKIMNLCKAHLAKLPNIIERWLIDLSPGTQIDHSDLLPLMLSALSIAALTTFYHKNSNFLKILVFNPTSSLLSTFLHDKRGLRQSSAASFILNRKPQEVPDSYSS